MALVGQLEVDTPADKVAEIKAKRLVYTLRHVHSEVLLIMPAQTLGEVQVKKPSDKLCDVKALTVVDVLAYMLAKKRERLAASPGEMWMLRHWLRCWLTG